MRLENPRLQNLKCFKRCKLWLSDVTNPLLFIFVEQILSPLKKCCLPALVEVVGNWGVAYGAADAGGNFAPIPDRCNHRHPLHFFRSIFPQEGMTMTEASNLNAAPFVELEVTGNAAGDAVLDLAR